MSDKDVADKAKADKTEDFEKRYNDSQSHIATIESENKSMREAAQKDKELLDAVSEHVDWAALNGTKKPEATGDGEALVDQKTLMATVQELKDQMSRNATTNSFRTKFPDMVEYEDIVGVFLQKTDARRPMPERIAKAVENTRNLLETERSKGRETDEQEKKKKAEKEAKAAGLTAAKGQKGSKDEPEGESYDEYLKGRQALQLKNMGM